MSYKDALHLKKVIQFLNLEVGSKCNFPMNHHVRQLVGLMVAWLVDQSVGPSFCHNILKGQIVTLPCCSYDLVRFIIIFLIPMFKEMKRIKAAVDEEGLSSDDEELFRCVCLYDCTCVCLSRLTTYLTIILVL